MIYNLNKDFYGPRHYLNQWFFQDILIVTDLDIWKCENLNRENANGLISQWLHEHPCKNVVVDLSQNCFISDRIPDCLRGKPTLTSMYDEWYGQSTPNIYFFPIWMYTYSQRNNIRNEHYCNRFDALGTKTQGVMCLNRGGRIHRLKFFNLIKDYEDRMCLTVPVDSSTSWQNKRLIGDTLLDNGLPAVELGVENPVYDQYAVNVVTETQINYPSITEKCCKPFIARQIPVIVGNAGVNQFHVDIGFDMFEDLIPWRTWDNQVNQDIRLEKIAEFVKQWIDSGTILKDYRQVQDRVERNKQYFHSEKFRDLIMKNMPKINPYQF
jgi:hypothetical protein